MQPHGLCVRRVRLLALVTGALGDIITVRVGEDFRSHFGVTSYAKVSRHAFAMSQALLHHIKV
jgi:hypothetical protein